MQKRLISLLLGGLLLITAAVWAGESIFDPGGPAQNFGGPVVFSSTATFSGNTASSMLYLNASKVLTSAVATNGQLLLGSTGAVPVLGTLGAGTSFTVTQGAGTLSIDFSNAVNTPGRFINTVLSVSVADEGTGAAAPFTLTPTRSYVEITCNDANGCNATFDETGAVQGHGVRIINIGANTVNFADTAGLSELAGAFAAGQWDTLTVGYASDRWVEYARSNN